MATAGEAAHQAVAETHAAGGAAVANADSVFVVRNNEIFLMSQPRPLRLVHRAEGWSVDTLASHGLPALKGSFVPMDRSADVFSTRSDSRADNGVLPRRSP